MTIAVDFDGTIVTHRYPDIGKEVPFAIKTLKMLQKDGHRLILWSVREGKLLQDAVESRRVSCSVSSKVKHCAATKYVHYLIFIAILCHSSAALPYIRTLN